MNVIIVDKRDSALWLAAKNREKTGLYKVFAALDFLQPSDLISAILNFEPRIIIFGWRSCVTYISNDFRSMDLLRKYKFNLKVAILIPDHLDKDYINYENKYNSLDFADYFFVTSNRLYEIYKQSPYAEKLSGVLHDIPDYEFIENLNKIDKIISKEEIIIWVGNSKWGERQGYQDHKRLSAIMLPAFELLISRDSAFRLLVIDSAIEFIENRKVLEKIHASDVLVQTSISEGTGLPLIEAAGLGTLVITTNVGVADELLTGRLSILISNPEPSEISEKIISQLPNKKELGHLLKEAYNHYITQAFKETIEPSVNIIKGGSWRQQVGNRFFSLSWFLRYLKSSFKLK